MMRTRVSVVLGLCAVALVVGCKEKTPNRDYIPVIKQQVFALQEAIKQRGKPGLDSLLTPDYAANGGADSVVQFAYGDKPGFQFERFGKAEIFYTDKKARVDGNIVGSDGQVLKDMVLIYEHRGDRWLLKRIEPREEMFDSATAAVDSEYYRVAREKAKEKQKEMDVTPDTTGR